MKDTVDLQELIVDISQHKADFSDLIDILAPNLKSETPLEADKALKLSTALHEIEESVTDLDTFYQEINNCHHPAMALNEAGQVIALNAAAAHFFQIRSGDGIATIGISPEDFHSFKERLSIVTGATLLKSNYLINSQNTDSPPLILMGTYNSKRKLFLLSTLQQQWSENIDRAFAEIFELSFSERSILALMSRGLTANEIAIHRGSAVTTVRQQIKTILQKLGAKNQVQAATLAATACITSQSTQTNYDRLELDYDDNPLIIGASKRGSRNIGWRRFGMPGGTPVLLLHGPSFGAGDYPQERQQAIRYQLDILAIERPGYGRTSPPERQEDPLSCQLDDITKVLDENNIDVVYLIAHEVALITALSLTEHALTEHVQLKILGIVSVSAAPPFRELEQINAMPAHQAIFIQSARHAPWLAKLMLRLLIVRMRKLGPEKWTQVIFEGIAPDEYIISQPHMKSGVIATYGFYVNQVGAGFLTDLKVMIKDWSNLLNKVNVPLKLLHGTHNQSTPLTHLEVFRKINPELEIVLFDNEGLTLAISQTELIYKELQELIKSNNRTVDGDS